MKTLCGTILAVAVALAAFGNDGNCPVAASGQTVRGGDEHPSRGVIARFAGDEVAAAIKIEEIPCAPGGRQVYEIADNGRTVRGSSPTAICRAFYDNAKSKNAAIATWSGKRFDATAVFAPSPDVRVEAPVRYFQAFNVVTFGYSLPFWNERRWMEELDWMALHGINMALATIADEEIAFRVMKRFGVPEEKIDAWFTGPAHLPWFRMGNLSGYPDRLPRQWRERSVRLQHAVLARMRELGIEPIVHGFAGFVPEALREARDDVRLREVRWFSNHAWFLSPDQPVFREIARAWVEEWEKEFGKTKYYLADSFNELKFTWKDEDEIRKGLAHCAENTFGGIRDANPEAVWAMQGWMFMYDADSWPAGRYRALTENIPDDGMLVLDLATDYSLNFRNGNWNWTRFDGFGGKSWIWSVIPNMGGSNDFGYGPLEYYANGRDIALASSKRGNLVGLGSAPEGIECMEPVLELVYDSYWRPEGAEKIDLKEWFRRWSLCRYGACPPALEKAWDAFVRGPWSNFHDHPRFRWQASPAEQHWIPGFEKKTRVERLSDGSAAWWGEVDDGEMALREEGAAAMREAAKDPALAASPLFRYDLAEYTSLVDGYRVDRLLYEEQREREAMNTERALELRRQIREGLLDIDARLRGHPLFDMSRWVGMARDCAEGDAELADLYAKNARRIITVWGPPVNDYSARMWSGLISDFYLGRLDAWWYQWDNGLPATVTDFEREYVEKGTNGRPSRPK